MSVTMETITETEQAHNDAQFNLLNPINGFVTGNQAREVFVKSGLSVPILAQVWQLADYNKDGKMDRLEFSIAMHLIRCVLAGQQLPATLPDSLKPAALIIRMAGAPSSVANPIIRSGPPVSSITPLSLPNMASSLGSTPVGPTVAPVGNSYQPGPLADTQAVKKVKSDWSIPHAEKLKYCQQFNQLDKQRTGALNGVHARNVLAQSQLPNVTLAEIWSLSDVNKDGRLSVEEFCIAMHLIDSVKAGYLLPKGLPPELMPAVVRMKSESPVPEPGTLPAQKISLPKTFEDRRKDNYDRGQAELDRRRQILKEQEERRLAELERKEKEEAERRERERQEAERRRQAEREAELQREREREAARLAEERRIAAEKEEARKEMERQRKADLDAIRIREATSQRQNEIDNTAERQQRKKTLSFQLQALTEKSSELNSSITSARERIVAITGEIEQMKEQRDAKVARIRQLETDARQLSVQCEQLAHESLQLRVDCSSGRGQDIETLRSHSSRLREQLQDVRNEMRAADDRSRLQQQLNSKKKAEIQEYSNQLHHLSTSNASLREHVRVLQQKAIELLRKRQEEQIHAATAAAADATAASTQKSLAKPDEVVNNASSEVPEAETATAVSLPSAGAGTDAVKYRALYEFNARTDDELSFQPGDIILVFEGHAAEPGWLAGQMRDKVGWFPLAFAEPIAPVASVSSQPPQTVSSVPTSPSSEPLQSIIEEPTVANKNALADTSTSQVVNGTSANAEISPTVIGTAVAQYQWKARNESELSFSKNDKIEILEQMEMRWKGRNSSGQIGWFPKSYVKMQEGGKTVPQRRDSKSKPVLQTVKSTTSESGMKNATVERTVYDAVTLESPSSAGQGEWCVALYDFQASEANDLELKAGDRIWVTEAVEDWWKGTCGGRSGIFPANYVQKCPVVDAKTAEGDFGIAKAVAVFEATADNQISLRVGDMVKIHSKPSSEWWQGEVISPGGGKKVGWFPGNYVELQDQNEVITEALYDYTAQRDDELTFHSGDLIVVTDSSDPEWWKGHLKKTVGGGDALFPSNYVRVSCVDNARNDIIGIAGQGTSSEVKKAPSASYNDEHSLANSKLKKLTEELFATELRFHRDLRMCQKLFADNLSPVIGKKLAKQLFLNIDELSSISGEIADDLRRKKPGDVFVEKTDRLNAYVKFCSNQQRALEILNDLELNNLEFKQTYRKCCENPNARGLNLSYLILLPMGRITRYPLLFEKLMKYTSKESAEYENLEIAYQLLKARCAEVNNVISEMDNANMLLWAQQHIHCDSIKPPIVFPSRTRYMGPRMFLHAGILYKQRSGRMLVALLFNDFLLLTTPAEPLEKVESFKVTKNSDVKLNLYKTPLLLNDLIVICNKESDEGTFSLKSGGAITGLRAVDRNARVLWVSQIEKAIDNYQNETRQAVKQNDEEETSIGSLLVELVCVKDLEVEVQLSGEQLLVCKMELGGAKAVSDVNLKARENLSTQLPITSTDSTFQISVYIPRLYSPDICAGVGEIAVSDLLSTTASHRGPISRRLDLAAGEMPSTHPFVILKFVVQMFY